MTPDGVRCDKCDRDLGNGNVILCMVISRFNPDTAAVDTYHFCEDVKSDDNSKLAHKGCARTIMTPTHLKAYSARIEKEKKVAKKAS